MHTDTTTKYRLYADGHIIHQDDFNEADHRIPYYDDYEVIEIPDVLVEYIAEG